MNNRSLDLWTHLLFKTDQFSPIRDEPEIINEVVRDRGIKTIMELEQLNHIKDIKRFLNGTDIVAFNVLTTKQERYQWTHKALKKDPYQNLANISVSHLYNLRRSKTYQRQRCSLTKTRPKKVEIGIRRKHCSNDQPGYICIDSFHQGDQDKRKGIYPINAVDAVTQFQVIVTVEGISEAFMLHAIQQILAVFPFQNTGIPCRQWW